MSEKIGTSFFWIYLCSEHLTLRANPNAVFHWTNTGAVCVYLRARRNLLGFHLALVGHAGGLLFAEVDVSLGRALVEPPLTVGALDVV